MLTDRFTSKLHKIEIAKQATSNSLDGCFCFARQTSDSPNILLSSFSSDGSLVFSVTMH
eukprot:m.70886 g.70886  ORF g.70886 m.70886 type:complete len:59 (+) comp12272_c0_seq1:2145-2321(+)